MFSDFIPVTALSPVAGAPVTKYINSLGRPAGFLLPVILYLASGGKVPFRVFGSRKKDLPANLERDNHMARAGRYFVKLINGTVSSTLTR